jgi:hypothetical protein
MSLARLLYISAAVFFGPTAGCRGFGSEIPNDPAKIYVASFRNMLASIGASIYIKLIEFDSDELTVKEQDTITRRNV